MPGRDLEIERCATSDLYDWAVNANRVRGSMRLMRNAPITSYPIMLYGIIHAIDGTRTMAAPEEAAPRPNLRTPGLGKVPRLGGGIHAIVRGGMEHRRLKPPLPRQSLLHDILEIFACSIRTNGPPPSHRPTVPPSHRSTAPPLHRSTATPRWARTVSGAARSGARSARRGPWRRWRPWDSAASR